MNSFILQTRMLILIHMPLIVLCNRNNFVMLYAAKKQKSRVVNSAFSSHETDATPKYASDLVSDDEHGEQLVRPQENIEGKSNQFYLCRLFFQRKKG
jgi:hypothetical protein